MILANEIVTSAPLSDALLTVQEARDRIAGLPAADAAVSKVLGNIIAGVSARCAAHVDVEHLGSHERVAAYTLWHGVDRLYLSHWINPQVATVTHRAPDSPDSEPVVFSLQPGGIVAGEFWPGIVEITYTAGWPATAAVIDAPANVVRAAEGQVSLEWFGRGRDDLIRQETIPGVSHIQYGRGRHRLSEALQEALGIYRRYDL